MTPLTIGALCAGYGGLELGLAQVMDLEPRWYSEYESPTKRNPTPSEAAAKVLAHRFPGIPNHGDLTAVDWDRVAPVDIVTGGWPCQPWSQAGTRKGAEDERAIWPYVAAAICAVRPRYVFLENVSAIAGAGELARACGDLAALGYVGSWRSLRASDVRAPHRRERIFILAAHTAGERLGSGPAGHRPVGPAGRWRADDRRGGQPVADADRAAADSEGERWGEGRPEPARQLRGSDAALRGDAATHPDGDGCEGVTSDYSASRSLDIPSGGHADGCGPVDWAGYAPAIERWESILGRQAPAPTVLGKRGGRQLNPRFVEWLMGLPTGWVCDVPGLTRNQKLKVLGNGVVPLQAATAWRLLFPLLADRGLAA